MPEPIIVHADMPELKLLKRRGGDGSTNTVLLGTALEVIDDSQVGWYEVQAFGTTGWVQRSDTTEHPRVLKVFATDVGQGDACLIEFPGGKRMLVDGGKNADLHDYLTGFKYKWQIERGEIVRLDAVVISHFDYDHFNRIRSILKDDRFEIGTMYHNGIARFRDTVATRRPATTLNSAGRIKPPAARALNY